MKSPPPKTPEHDHYQGEVDSAEANGEKLSRQSAKYVYKRISNRIEYYGPWLLHVKWNINISAVLERHSPRN